MPEPMFDRFASCARRSVRQRLRAQLWSSAAATVLFALTCGAAWGAVPQNWKESGYAYNAKDVPLIKVLTDFARSHGVELHADVAMDATVSGTVKTSNAADFLDRLAARHRFQWFVYNQVLYVSPTSDMTSQRIEVSREAMTDAKSVLTGVGLFESKFGWGEMPESSTVAVSGPREYVGLVRELIEERDRSNEYEAMVFRLKNAAVDDRSVTIRNQTVVTPGAASLLKSMLSKQSGSSGRALTGGGGMLDGVMGQPSLPTPPSALGQAETEAPTTNAAKRTNTARVGSGGRGVSVEGDVRTNSIVIYDLAKRRGYYQRLINAIDVPQQLVEIEACVVDVNRDRVSELGFGFEATHGRGSVTVDPTGILAAPITGGSTLIVSSLDRFFARLTLMEQDGQARVVAKPSVLTLENLVAVLDLSQTVFLRATGERVATIEQVTAGMLLRVTPRVVKDKTSTQVHLTVDIEDGKVLPGATSADSPEVQRSTISTQAVLLDRQSLIIGGYDAKTASSTDNSVPGVSKIPLVGALFTGKKKLDQSRQRLFILTPRLVYPAGPQPTKVATARPPQQRKKTGKPWN